MKIIRYKNRLIVFVIGFVSLLLSVTPLFAAVTLNSSLAVTETYTDNLFFESQSAKRDDFGTFIIPSLTLGYFSKDVEIAGTYTGIAQFYVNNSNANAYSHNANFAIDLPFLTKRYKGLEVQLIESFNFAPQLQGFAFGGAPGQEDASSAFRASASGGSTLSGGGGGGNLGGISGLNGSNSIGNQGVFTSRSRSNAFQNTAGMNVKYALSPRWTPTFKYLNNYVTFSDPQLNDSLTHQVGAGAIYKLSPRTQLRGNYTASFASISGGESFVTHSVTVGSSHLISPSLNVSSNVGVSWTESIERINFTTSSSIAKSFDRGSISLNYNQAVTPGGGIATSPTLSQTLVGTGNLTITENVSGFLSGGVSKNKSQSGNSVDITSYQGQAGINIVLLEWLDGTLSYSYIKQKSKGSAPGGRSATVNQGFIGLSATFPEWRLVK